MNNQDIQFTVQVYESLLKPSIYLGELRGNITGYGHVVSTFGGFDKADISIGIYEPQIDDWIANGIGRYIQVYAPDLSLVWEGYVDTVEVNYGSLRITRGPLSSICNRCSVAYAPVDTSTDPPTVGDGTFTTIADDAGSQAKYGIFERILSAGEVSTTEAEQIRDMYISENKEPETGRELSFGGGSLSVSLRCLGVMSWLENYIYNNTLGSGFSTVTERIKSILAADPNGIFDADLSNIQENLILVAAYEGDSPTAMTAIKELVAMGDIGDNRYQFGFFAGRKAHYKAVSKSYEYLYRLRDPSQKITNTANIEIPPWLIQPARWIKTTDFLVGQGDTVIQDDPRSIFIESASYGAPYSLQIQHSRSSALERRLARLKGITV